MIHGVGAAAARSRPLPVKGGKGVRAGAAATAATATSATPPAAAAAPGSCLARPAPVDFGYEKNIEDKYIWGKELGKGGNGVVRVVSVKALRLRGGSCGGVLCGLLPAASVHLCCCFFSSLTPRATNNHNTPTTH